MESGGGSQGPCPECGRPAGRWHKLDCTHGVQVLSRHRTEMQNRIHEMVERDRALNLGPQSGELTADEADAIANGEPYCFRCGKPASSFPEYDYQFAGGDRADYVRNQEGTYNPDTNRFACDVCYIVIGTPSSPGGWRAP